MDLPDGVAVKINRAKAHLEDFDVEASAIEQACRKAIVRERDEKRSEQVFKIGQVPEVPPILSGILGDAIHNLRVALDHLAWELVLRNGDKPPVVGPGGTGFPILTTPLTPDRWGRSRPQIVPGVPKKLREILDEVQPYKRGNPAHHELAILHALDIGDKHHKLLVAVVGVRNLGWFGEVELTDFNPGPYEDGDEVCRFRITDAESEAYFDPLVGFTVCLNEPAAGPWRATVGAGSVVRQSLRYIEHEVLPRLRDYL